MKKSNDRGSGGVVCGEGGRREPDEVAATDRPHCTVCVVCREMECGPSHACAASDAIAYCVRRCVRHRRPYRSSSLMLRSGEDEVRRHCQSTRLGFCGILMLRLSCAHDTARCALCSSKALQKCMFPK